jgi:hypothetical protein
VRGRAHCERGASTHFHERSAVSDGGGVDKTLLGVIEEVMACFYGKESCGSKGFAKGSLSVTFNRGEEEEGGNGGGGGGLCATWRRVQGVHHEHEAAGLEAIGAHGRGALAGTA